MTKQNILKILLALIAIAAIICVYLVVIDMIDGSKQKNKPTAKPTESITMPPNITKDPLITSTPVIVVTPSLTTPDHLPTPTKKPTEIPTKTPTASITVTTTKPGAEASACGQYKGKKLIALTFDDGPNYVNTPRLLDVLKEYKVRATFFVLGELLQNSPTNRNVILREYQEGHEIAIHSFDHENFTKLTAEQIKKQMSDTVGIVKQITGESPKYFRPPYGSYNKSVSDAVGMAIVLWSIDTRDWAHISDANIKKYAEANGKTTDEAKGILIKELLFDGYMDGTTKRESVVSQLKHGRILLFHDIHPATADAVRQLLAYLAQHDEYVALPLDEFFATEGSNSAPGDVYSYIWEGFATQKANW